MSSISVPRESHGSADGLFDGCSDPLLLFDGARASWCAPRHAAWSDHYASQARSPEVVTPAPWVLSHYLAKAPSRVLVGPDGQLLPGVEAAKARRREGLRRNRRDGEQEFKP